MDDDQKQWLYESDYIKSDELNTEDWAYVWSVCIYYSALVIGGNELQPAQPTELLFVVFMNIFGLLFLTWIAGEIAVLVATINLKSQAYQDEIDSMNTAMKNAGLSNALSAEIREHFLKVQGTMVE